MPNIKVNGIVTRYANYRESDRILTILTDERGLLTVAARGCRRAKSPILAGSELFAAGEFDIFANKDKHTLNDCCITEAYFPLREDVSRFSAASYMLSLVNAGLSDEQGAAGVLELLMYSLTYTAYSDCDAADMAICFAVKLLDRLGFCPTITFCALCGAELTSAKKLGFSAEAGGALCHSCAGENSSVSVLSMEAMRRMLLLPISGINKVRLPVKVRNELLPLINAYAEYVLDKSFKAVLTI